jgi:hypothetical protein
MSKRKTRAELELELDAAHKKIRQLQEDETARSEVRAAIGKVDADRDRVRREQDEKRRNEAETARELIAEAYAATVATDEALLSIATTPHTEDAWRDALASAATRTRQTREAIQKIATLEIVRVPTFSFSSGLWSAISIGMASIAYALFGVPAKTGASTKAAPAAGQGSST